MDYYKILNFDREPFSNSPDPDFFYQSRQHLECLQKIELSVRLRRGLSVIIGDVGTGKTTLCRQLIRKLSGDDKVETHLILDPYFSTSRELLGALAEMMTKQAPEAGATEWQLNEAVKRHLFRSGVDEDKIVVLIIDEGQKIPDFCLEILRELLNYETNTYKLLQIVIFAQKEFQQFLDAHLNFMDRINMRHDLVPLGFRETRALIQFRLERAHGLAKGGAGFSLPALWSIYRATGGYPRKIINLCHRLILNLIVQNRTRVTRKAVRSCIRAVFPETAPRWKRRLAVAAGGLAAAFVVAAVTPSFLNRTDMRFSESPVVVSKHIVPPAPPKTLPGESANVPSVGVQPSDAEASLPPSQTEQGARTPEELLKEAAKGKREGDLAALARQADDVLPQFLGQIAAVRGDYLRSMVRKIYGRHDREVLDSVVRANDGITNPNRIEAGQVIRFPAIPVRPEGRNRKACRIQVARMTDLQKAFQFVREHSTRDDTVRMIPCWNKKDGLQFVVVCARPFPNEDAAGEALRQLPEALASQAAVLAKWEAETIFFADF